MDIGEGRANPQATDCFWPILLKNSFSGDAENLQLFGRRAASSRLGRYQREEISRRSACTWRLMRSMTALLDRVRIWREIARVGISSFSTQ
jgi:hypothetical protein